MGASWLRFAVIWVAILAVIWWASTMTIYYTPQYVGRYTGRFGEWTPMHTVVAVDSPTAPAREEMIWRGALATFAAILGWLWIRAAIRLDRRRDRERQGNETEHDAA